MRLIFLQLPTSAPCPAALTCAGSAGPTEPEAVNLASPRTVLVSGDVDDPIHLESLETPLIAPGTVEVSPPLMSRAAALNAEFLSLAQSVCKDEGVEDEPHITEDAQQSSQPTVADSYAWDGLSFMH